ncbi:hypothetical protein [Gordonia sp. NPDC003950]
MAVEACQDPAAMPEVLKRIADQPGAHPEALRMWVKQAEVDGRVPPGTGTNDAEHIAQVERENLVLRRTRS